ncbi:hypothetical protein M3O96_16880 [Aquiflexum sp. TKW24L]|uniref:O-antigen ligase family protein n=1 Tax=Aquiflexum sp. TKW24L TaxID=2942212 RepID=UPI0020C0E022|nr:hypothetical protein [Aquiflexum sp. TKW24L]MCL6260779.1 hypothetical protein [Aquiflexum sp. TKW24L]
MKGFFLLVEFALPILTIYLIVKKQSLIIIYVPFILFSYHIIETRLPGFFHFLIVAGILFYVVIYNLPFVKQNPFSILIFLYFLFLLKNIEVDFKTIRPYFINVTWLFLGVALIPYIFKRYSREKVFYELSTAAFLVMLIFSINTGLSTIFKYNPRAIYGITSGILFGNVSNDYYNIFPLALFLILRRGIRDKNVLYLGVYFVSVFLVLLTLRRTVMVLSLIGTILVMVELLDFQKIKQFLLYSFITLIITVVVISNTSFLPQLLERYESRDLDNRELEGEGRLMELDIIYKDLFVYYDYDPWFGYRLDDSKGNYGKRIFGERSLHTDFANLIHASGILGLFLYLMMILIAFYSVWRRILTKDEFFQFWFIVLCFGLYFFTGRYTTANAMLMMFAILFLPFAKSDSNSPIIKNNHQ